MFHQQQKFLYKVPKEGSVSKTKGLLKENSI